MLALVGCQQAKMAPPAFPPPQVTVVKPASYPVQGYYEYNGSLEAVEAVEIKARVKGLLKAVQFTEGEEVKKGDPLFTIDQREYLTAVARAKADVAKAAADIENWKAQIKLAEADLERMKRTAASGASAATKELVERLFH